LKIMKISLSQKVDLGLNHGPQLFMKRLMTELIGGFDVQLVDSGPSDIHLILVAGQRKPQAKNVVRLDGVYYDQPRLGANLQIARCLMDVDGAVFQSHWSMQAIKAFIGFCPPRHTVVYNGMDQSVFNGITGDKRGFDKVFLACAHWHPSKRIDLIIRAFRRMQPMVPGKVGLFIAGDGVVPFKDDHILFFGDLCNEDVLFLYKSADYLCQVSYSEWCSNVLIEALSAGLPVVSNNIGGNPELVGQDGVIVELDKPCNFEIFESIDQTDGRDLDPTIVTQGMMDIMERHWSVHRPDLNIAVSAAKYYQFFKSLLEE